MIRLLLIIIIAVIWSMISDGDIFILPAIKRKENNYDVQIKEFLEKK